MSTQKLTAFEQVVLAGLADKAGLAAALFEAWADLPADSVQSARSLVNAAQLGVTEEGATRDLLERASYILGIYKSLQILLPDQALADQWLATPNDNPLFNGTAPLDRLLAGQVVDLAVVRNFLDAERGGW